MDAQDKNLTNSALRGGKPYKTYIKTILGKVYITIWDSFENMPVGLLLEGDPRNQDETCMIDVWSEDEDFYFKSKNKRHLQTGDIRVYVRKTEEKDRTIEEFSDDELCELINSKFFTFQNVLNGTNSVAVLFRIKTLAQDLEKSDKIMKAIEARLSEVQTSEFKNTNQKVVEL